MAPRNAARPADTSVQITVAGMAADLYGFADERPPLVLLPGLTFDRRIWQPVLDHLSRIDPGRQVLALDLPGHGESPDQLPHSMQHITGLIHQAVEEAGLETPVMVGHSIAGAFASVYASQHPTRGVVNIDAPPDPVLLALLRSHEEQIRSDGFPGVWALMKQGFGTDLLPVSARHLVAHNSRPRQDLVVSYWDELLRQTPDQSDAMLAGSLAAVAASDVPYLLIAGAELAPGVSQQLSGALPRLKTEVWAGTGHFPHLAHPGRFARRLADTAQWRPRPKAGSLTPADLDWIIDAHFEAERRGDVDAILATVSDDISHEVLGAGLGKLSGKDAVRAFYEQLSQDLSIDAYTTVRRIHGPGHAWEEGVVHATAAGKPLGLDGGGRRVIYRLNHLFEFRNGLIQREFRIPDVAGIFAQLSQPEEQEEDEAMPLVAAVLTEAEWRHWDQAHNVKGKSLGRLAADGHWLMDGLDPARYTTLIHLVPAPVRIVIIKGYARRYRAECARRWGPSVPVGPAAAAPGRFTPISYLTPWRIL